jgi:hypothetical protein
MPKEMEGSMELTHLNEDGNLTEEEALGVLENAAIAANEDLPKALAKCTTEAERRKVKGDRDAVVLSYLRSLKKSLEKTGPFFEKMAKDLETETANVKTKEIGRAHV